MQRQRAFLRILLIFFGLALVAQSALAEISPESKIGSELGAFERKTAPRPLPQRAAPVIEQPKEGLPAAPKAPQVEYFVKRIRVEGVRSVLKKDIRAIVFPYEGQILTLRKAEEVTTKITQYYRLKGFVTSNAYLPAQRIVGQMLVISVVEGKIGKLSLADNNAFNTPWLMQYLTLKPGDVLRYSDIEQNAAALNGNPDRLVQAVLAQGTEPGATDVSFHIKTRLPIHFTYVLDNHGTRLSGRIRQGMEFRHNNVLGRDDMLFGLVKISEHGDFLAEAFNYVYPLRPRGGRLTFSYSHADVELGKELRPLNVKGGANVWGVGYAQPIVDTPIWSLDFDAGFDMKEIWSTLDGLDISRDHLRVIHFGPSASVRDPWGNTSFKGDLAFGLSGFLGGNVKADSRSNKAGTGGQFLIENLEISRVQRFFFDSMLIPRFETQLTKYRLVSSEQFQAGGYDTVRGYGEGDSLGDYGFLTGIEWRVPPYLIPKDYKIPGRDQTFWDALQLVGFVDVAKTYLRNPGVNQSASRRLIGVGGGLRVNLRDFANAQIDWGVPVGDIPEDGVETRLHFALNTQLPFGQKFQEPKNISKVDKSP